MFTLVVVYYEWRRYWRETTKNTIMKPKVFSAWANGMSTQIKAYRKENAIKEFQRLDPKIGASDVNLLKGVKNSHQAAIDEDQHERAL